MSSDLALDTELEDFGDDAPLVSSGRVNKGDSLFNVFR